MLGFSQDKVTARAGRKALHEARAMWVHNFENALCSLLDYEMREAECVKAVSKAALVADAAVAEIEQRWTR